MSVKSFCFVSLASIILVACGKDKGSDPAPPPAPPTPTSFSFSALTVDGKFNTFTYYQANVSPVIRVSFNAKLMQSSGAAAVSLKDKAGAAVATTITYENNDSTLVIRPTSPLKYLTAYSLDVSNALKSSTSASLLSGVTVNLTTKLDSSRKFPAISDDALLTLVQQQTFKYFWDFGHPVSGLARERNNGDNNLVTSGGSGFGVMSMLAGVKRGFITRTDALTRMTTIVSFLKNTAQKFHGAFPHWLNGTTGAVIPFSTNDNGADLVETSYLIQGLLCARQYFDGASAAESNLRADINAIWNGVEWDWFRQNNQNVLYWHWSPDKQFVMNLPIKGWNECLVTYVLGASSTTHAIPKTVYDNGWASNGAMKNGNTYYGYTLPLGPAAGGPLFLEHYSFLGINPNNLSDAYANYQTQTKNHTLINYNYCRTNPNSYQGYSDSVWGLTASDIEGGYTASSPTNDRSFIAPTAALSSFPYTPAESMAALKFFYYVLGDKIWKEYGFVDAFSINNLWFANSFLAIDQGPIIVMIENYRSSMLWDLFTSCPEVKTGMRGLGFTAPYL